MLVAGDVYRPAAIDQLSILGKQVLEFYCLEVDPLQLFEKYASFKYWHQCHFKVSIETFVWRHKILCCYYHKTDEESVL